MASWHTDFSVIIPARLSSTRLPEKALADIHGKPMVVRTALAAKRSRAKRVVVATDSQAILTSCQYHHIDCILTSDQHQSGTDRLAEAVQLLRLPENEIVVNVQGDEPLINPKLINEVAYHLAQSQVAMSTAAHPITQSVDFNNINVVKVVLDKWKNALYFSRASIPLSRNHANELPEILPALRHIGIYAYRAGFLQEYHQLSPSPLEQCESLEQLRVLWHGYRIGVYVCDESVHTGVDTAQDLEYVRQYFLDHYLSD